SLILCRPLISPLFPYTTLFRSPDWPPRQGIGTLSPAALKTDRTDRLSGKPHKTSRYRAWQRMTERLDHYKRTLHRRKKRRSATRSEEHTSELQSPYDLVCRLLL